MLKKIVLKNFRGFRQFTTSFGKFAVVVGPNNAGKSTLISALRSSAEMIAYAKRNVPSKTRTVEGERFRVHLIAPGQFSIDDESLRHEFQYEAETSFEVSFDNKATLRAVWPPNSDHGYFYLIVDEGQPIDLARTRELFPTMGTVPVLRPVESRERLLDSKYVSRNLSGRLASSHFRNQLYDLDTKYQTGSPNQFDQFAEFCTEWLPEISLVPPTLSGNEIDVYYREGRRQREIAWAGDGMQVFLQLLLHVFRQRQSSTLILDEPEVYLHPDLERRSLELLKDLENQSIVATHSSEIIAGSPPESVIWVDRMRRSSVHSPKNETLDQLSQSIGTGFNLRLARLMRSKVALFVEGDDIRFLKRLSKTLGLRSLALEADIAVVPLVGAENYRKLESFDWIAQNFLKGAVRGYAIFDRDYLSQSTIKERKQVLGDAGIDTHVWRRHELESYLLSPKALGRISGQTDEWITEQLNEIISAMKSAVIGGMVSSRSKESSKRLDPGTIYKACDEEVSKYWDDPDKRLKLCPGKEILAGLNDRLQSGGFSGISSVRIAASMKSDEIPTELVDVLEEINRLATS